MKITILGLGKTGLSLARYFYHQGNALKVIDDRPEIAPEIRQELKNCEFFLGGKLPEFQSIERFFISPGVAATHPAAQRALEQGLQLEGELDLAFALAQGEVLAITGTNGKSTTTSLLGAMLKADGKTVGVGGNLGTPFLDLVCDANSYRYYVIEVSSFQLETTQTFRPKVAALLNLSEDHFERHENLAQYLEAKRKIFAFQQSSDFAVYNAEDLAVLTAVEFIQSQKIAFSNAKKVQGVYGNEQKLYWAPQGEILETYDLSTVPLKGLHNVENISAALAMAKLMGCSQQAIEQALIHFKGLPHRMEWIAQKQGVDYIDDSKATNVGAVVMSLASFSENVILILGGVDKGGDYSPLKALLRAKAKAVLLIGEAAEKIETALADSVELIRVGTMKAAVERAAQLASPGCTVLLSPACSSFDQYSSYAERGMDFQNLVKNLN